MEIQDLDQVVDIEKSIFSMPWSKKSFKDSLYLDETIYLVAEENEKILGYCGIYIVINEGNITNVAVRKEDRKRGVAHMLIDKLLHIAKERSVTTVLLEVRESNIPAQRLYMKIGFREQGKRTDFYERPTESAVIMIKRY